MSRFLIVNADDFGLSEGVNRGIIEAADHGILTSASLMVRYPAATDAAAYARNGGAISVGLHLDLGEWFYRDPDWVPLYTVVPTDDAAAVSAEIDRQLAEFCRLMGREPSHLDSHQHVHRHEPVRALLSARAQSLGVPLREVTPGIHHCGDFYGQTGEGETIPEALTVRGLETILQTLPSGVTELGCHPGYGEGLATSYRTERAAEVRVLCAPETRQSLTRLNIKLCSFANRPR